MRTAGIIIGAVCVATVLSELLGLGFLWYRGQLNPAAIAEMRHVLSGDDAGSFDAEEEQQNDQPSNADYAQQRVTRILELGTREEELDLLKRVVTDTREVLKKDREAFKKQKDIFEDELKKHQETTASVAMEQTRGILLALQPNDAVDNLMALTTEDNVMLLKGMPEKSIAQLLEQFLNGDDSQKLRGQEIFKAISQGDPSRKLIDGTLSSLNGQQPSAN